MEKLKHRKKKGYMLLEAVIALSILILIIGSFFFSRGYYLKEKFNQDKIIKEMLFLEALKNEIYHNQSFNNLLTLCEKEYYINNQYMDVDSIKHRDLMQIIEEEEIEGPYTKIYTTLEEDILNIRIVIEKDSYKKETKLYKGNY
ncbi:hypothetical protein [Clostridium amazonitimonense]|uniref:hypothetical protein n=1 Tax=Clostridium amazonitimonense TaxID=1499689 RepID=UPI0005096E55|nr:hypothetical protein [Clostridium amazonitimonense]